MREGILIILAMFLAWGFWFYAETRCNECTTDSECETWCGRGY